jgi:hypothetical protein
MCHLRICRIIRCSSRSSVSEEHLIGSSGPCLSVAFIVPYRQPALPGVIAGRHCCNSGNRDRCWKTLLQQWEPRSLLEHILTQQWEPRSLLEHIVAAGVTEAILGIHCCNSGNRDHCWSTLLNGGDRGHYWVTTMISDHIISIMTLISLLAHQLFYQWIWMPWDVVTRLGKVININSRFSSNSADILVSLLNKHVA